MHDLADDNLGPHDAIARLEARIEALESKIESCRKFEAAARLALALGGVLLAGLMVRLIAFDPLALTAAIAAGLGGIVMRGSNRSTRNEAEMQLAAAEAERAALIGAIELHVVGGRETLH